MKPSSRAHRLAALLTCGLATGAMGPASADLTTLAMPWIALAAAQPPAQTAAQTAAPSRAAASTGHSAASPSSQAASGPHSDGADAVLRDRQRATPGHSLKRADRQFVMHALASGQAEVELARLAQSRAQDAELKRFAERMVEDHTRVNGELMAIADPSRAGTAAGNRADPRSSTGSSPASSTGAGTSPHAGQAGRGAGAASAAGQAGAASDAGLSTGRPGDTPEAGSPRLSATAERTLQRLQGLSGTAFDRAFIRQMVSDHRAAVADFQRAASGAADPGVRAFARETLPGLQEHLQQARTLSDRLGRGQP